MKVIIFDQVIEMENKESSVVELLNLVQDLAGKEQSMVSQMIIDDYSVYGDFEDYLYQHITEIDTITVITKTMKEIAGEIIITARDYLERALPEIKPLADEFYHAPKDNAFNSLVDLINGMEWLMQLMYNLAEFPEDYQDWTGLTELWSNLQGQLVNLEEALQVKDWTLIGDILNFEITPIYEDGYKEITNIIGSEVMKHDLN